MCHITGDVCVKWIWRQKQPCVREQRESVWVRMEKKTRYLQAAGRRGNRVKTPPPLCARFSLHSNTTKARNNPEELISDQSFTSRLWDCKSLHHLTNQIQRFFFKFYYLPVRASVRWRSTRTKVHHSVSHTHISARKWFLSSSIYGVWTTNNSLSWLHTTLQTCEYISVGLLELIRTTALPITNNTWPMY